MCKEQRVVSLWVGTAKSAAALEEYMTFRHSEDGDAIPSPFSSGFGIARFDEDFREAEVIKPATRSMHRLLSGFSYDDVIVPRFVNLCGAMLDAEVDAVVLLYNFNYDGRVESHFNDDVRLKFLGGVTYS